MGRGNIYITQRRAVGEAEEGAMMSHKRRFKKQYKPIGFGDGPDPGAVEGHRGDTPSQPHDERTLLTNDRPGGRWPPAY